MSTTEIRMAKSISPENKNSTSFLQGHKFWIITVYRSQILVNANARKKI